MVSLNPLIDLFFTEFPLPDRVEKIAECGYRYIETWQGSDKSVLTEIAKACKNNNVKLVSVVLNSPGDKKISPADKTTHQAFLEQIDQYSDNALSAGCYQGIITSGEKLDGVSVPDQQKAAAEAIRKAGEITNKKNFNIVLEPLNTKVDHKGHFLDSRYTALDMVKSINLNNVKMLYDIYHMQIMHGNHTAFITENISYIGHFHSAGVPGRHELFNNEIDYAFLYKKICQFGYDGFVGMEYIPQLNSKDSLTKTLDYLKV
jgi:hydroxypyruvate isomerase